MTIIEALQRLRNDLKTWVANNLRTKVDKEDGKGLSSNDFTNEDKAKLNDAATKGYVDNKVTPFVITVDENGIANKTYREIDSMIKNTGGGKIVIAQKTDSINLGGLIFTNFRNYEQNRSYIDVDTENNVLRGTIYKFSCAENDTIYNCVLTIPNPSDETYDNYAVVTFNEESISSKMDKENPTGTGSFSLNRKDGSAIGNYSFAEGYDVEADGWSAHAEGSYTIARGMAAHAEGHGTIASANFSHTEGSSTQAQSENQHVQGKFNIIDNNGKYAHIVGNGELEANSNAHTLDWSGNAWFAGDIYVGGTGQDDENAVKVLTENDLQGYAPTAEPFIITITNYACDKTKEEILSAIESGNVIACEPEIGESLAVYTWYTFSGADLSNQTKVVYFSCIKDHILYEFSIDCSGEQNEYPTASVPSALILGSGSLSKATTSVDLSGFETEGKIVETYSDGTSLTYNFEFNSEGNPTKITDSDGNETVLTW